MLICSTLIGTLGSTPSRSAKTIGQVAERLMALVLKTSVGDEPTVGSNPTLSAKTHNGLLVEWLKTSACHAEDHGFDPRTGRH